MTDAVQIAFIAILPATLASLGALIASMRNKAAIQEVHQVVNSRMDQMLELTRKSSKAEGVKEGVDAGVAAIQATAAAATTAAEKVVPFPTKPS